MVCTRWQNTKSRDRKRFHVFSCLTPPGQSQWRLLGALGGVLRRCACGRWGRERVDGVRGRGGGSAGSRAGSCSLRAAPAFQPAHTPDGRLSPRGPL